MVHENHTAYTPIPTATPYPESNTSAAAPATPPRQQAKTGLRELFANEYREGDAVVRYHLRIPLDCVPGSQTLTVMLGGREFHVDVPDYIAREETVVVIAPAVVSYGEA